MNLTLKAYIDWVKNKSLNPKDVINTYILQAKQKNTNLNAFVRFHEDYVQNNIDVMSTKALCWAPIWIKDIILTKWYISSCSSNIIRDFVSPYSATCFENLEKNWWLMIGKTNMDEFAMGSSTESSAFGNTLNPFGINRIPGGSSGWSAAAVAADMCIAALGTDTGGSIRQPAAFCGLVGIKPTYGRVSRYGVQSMASSLDQVGVMTKTVEDAEILLKAISGFDPKDSQSSTNADSRKPAWDVKTYKIAVPKEALWEGLDPRIKEKFLMILEKLRGLWIVIEEIDLPILGYAVPMYYTLMPAEVSTNLSRFDWIKFGTQDNTFDYPDIMSYYQKVRSEWFGDEAKRRILLWTFVLSSANYEWYYLKAQKARQQLQRDFAKIFTNYDLVLTPTTPTLPCKIWEKIDNPLVMYLEDMYTIPANMWWLPAMSVPIGMAEDRGELLPVGIQIMWNKREEEKIFSLGKVIEWLN